MWTMRRREAAEEHESKTRDRLRRLVDLEAKVMQGDPVAVENRIRQMSYGHRTRP
jgi:hypothetical protein